MLRHQVLQFIKEQLQRWEGGEGRSIRGVQLFVAPTDADRSMYETVVGAGRPEELKDEVQRIADDYSIELPEDWSFEALFVSELPQGAFRSGTMPLAVYVSHHKQSALTRPTLAYFNVLFGIAEHPRYELKPEMGKICIGREKKVQTMGGFMRENTIAFPGGKHESNNYVSREHAHVEWNQEAAGYYLFADAGGLPPRNKTKVKTTDGDLIKLQTTGVGYQLQEGDQVLLGESALLQFTYSE